MIELIGIPGAGKSHIFNYLENVDLKNLKKIAQRTDMQKEQLSLTSRNLFIILIYIIINPCRWHMKIKSLKWLTKYIIKNDKDLIEDEGFIQRILGILAPETGILNSFQKFLIAKLDLHSSKINIVVYAPVDIAYKRIRNRKPIIRFHGLNKVQILKILTGFDLVLCELRKNPSFHYYLLNNDRDKSNLLENLENFMVSIGGKNI